MGNVHAERIAALRAMMRDNGWDAVVVPSSDPHGSEYPAPRWKQVEWLSGFTGEAGDIVVTKDHAGLWTDSRYFIQAVQELAGSGVELHKMRIPGAEGLADWVARHADIVAVDGKCMSVSAVGELEGALAKTHAENEKEYGIADMPDMLDRIWDSRPWMPTSPITTLDTCDVGESRLHKIIWLRKFLMENGYDAILLSALDDIAWMLNARGSDIEYNPLVVSYLLVSLEDAVWFVRKGKSCDADTADSINEIEADGIAVMDYDDVALVLSGMEEGLRVYVDDRTLNYSLYKLLSSYFGKDGVVSGASPVSLRKAVKNAAETDSLREAFVEDGLAVEKFLYWLENNIGEGISEYEASVKLTSLRSEIPGYRGNSFENISAYGGNAALPHYRTPENGSALIRPHGLYLTDSGGQYLFGTTDITRTVPLGECSELEREDYTLVLKGMIALSSAVFPKGTAGCHLDALARIPLWKSKRNFGHGTGHGLGFFLCVHEGPQDVRQNFNAQPLLPGMVISNEPGIYREGMHGVRHENILLCKEAGSNSFGEWLCFETLTLCHIDTSAIIADLMTASEIRWVNDYNARVYEMLSPRLSGDIAAWLRAKTYPIGVVV